MLFPSGYFSQERRKEVEVEIIDIETQDRLKRVVILEQHDGSFEVFEQNTQRDKGSEGNPFK